jgi:hypothetical protein
MVVRRKARNWNHAEEIKACITYSWFLIVVKRKQLQCMLHKKGIWMRMVVTVRNQPDRRWKVLSLLTKWLQCRETNWMTAPSFCCARHSEFPLAGRVVRRSNNQQRSSSCCSFQIVLNSNSPFLVTTRSLLSRNYEHAMVTKWCKIWDRWWMKGIDEFLTLPCFSTPKNLNPRTESYMQKLELKYLRVNGG